MLELSEQNLIKEIIKKRDISCLCHFTPRENLESIRKNGLVCRNQLPYNAKITDNSRWDTHSNSICLSISKPNAWMFNKKEREGLDLALIILSPEILYEKNCLFFPHNAATKCYRYSPTFEFQGSEALEKLFANEVSYTKANGETINLSRYRKNLASYEATSDQAEVQCLENIEANYIIKVFEADIPLNAREIKRRISNLNTKISSISNVPEFPKLPELNPDTLRYIFNTTPTDIEKEEKKDYDYSRRKSSHSSGSDFWGYVIIAIILSFIITPFIAIPLVIFSYFKEH